MKIENSSCGILQDSSGDYRSYRMRRDRGTISFSSCWDCTLGAALRSYTAKH
jgi:hypothetical protein